MGQVSARRWQVPPKCLADNLRAVLNRHDRAGHMRIGAFKGRSDDWCDPLCRASMVNGVPITPWRRAPVILPYWLLSCTVAIISWAKAGPCRHVFLGSALS